MNNGIFFTLHVVIGREHEHFVNHKVDVEQLLSCSVLPVATHKQISLALDRILVDVVEYTQPEYGLQN